MATLKEYVAAVVRDIREGAAGQITDHGGAGPPKVKFRVGVTCRDDGETSVTGESTAGAGVVEFEMRISWPEG